MKAVVVGGGISGLACSALLAKRGFKVTLLEKNSQLGGRARQWRKDGFSFDMGPSWYMLPSVFEDFFSEFGKKPEDFYKLFRLETNYKAFYPDGSSFRIFSDMEKNKETFEKIESGSFMRAKHFLDRSKRFYDAAMKDLVYEDYESVFRMMRPSFIFSLLKLEIFRNYHDHVKRYFHTAKIQRLFEFMTAFFGAGPYNLPAFYSLISHADLDLKLWHPEKGMYQVVESLEKLCLEGGVEIRTLEPVKKLVVRRGSITKAVTYKGEYKADVFVSGADLELVERELLDGNRNHHYWDKAVMSLSAFMIYLGIDKKLKGLEHHNLYFDDSWEEHFTDVYRKPRWPVSPSYYVHVPSKTDKSMAPPGKDTMVILVPVAPGLDDKGVRESYADKIISHVERTTGEKIRDHVSVKRIFSHSDFIDDYNAYKGSAFGLAHTLWQSSFFRPRNKSKRIKNFWRVGHYTNPGISVPIALISAQIASRSIGKRFFQ